MPEHTTAARLLQALDQQLGDDDGWPNFLPPASRLPQLCLPNNTPPLDLAPQRRSRTPPPSWFVPYETILQLVVAHRCTSSIGGPIPYFTVGLARCPGLLSRTLGHDETHQGLLVPDLLTDLVILISPLGIWRLPSSPTHVGRNLCSAVHTSKSPPTSLRHLSRLCDSGPPAIPMTTSRVLH